MKNYYSLLKLPNTAPLEEIKKAIHTQLRLWSNRTNAPDLLRRQEAEQIVQHLQDAEAVLLDKSKRAEYDCKLQSQPAPSTAKEKRMDEKELSGENLIESGWRLLVEDRVADAIMVAKKATEIDASNDKAWALLGQAQFRWGEIDNAVYEYKRAIELRPNEATYYFDLGSVYESVQRWDQALQQYERAAKLDSSKVAYRSAVGMLLLKNLEYDEAINILESCIKEEPENTTYSWFLGLAYSDRAYLGWSWVGEGENVPPGCYATEKKHVEEAKNYITKAENLKFNDSELLTHIKEVKENINTMMARRFRGNMLAVVFYVIGGFFLIDTEGLAVGVGAMVIGFLYFIASRARQYVINKEIIAGVKTSSQMVAEAAADGNDGAERAGGFIGSFLVVMFLLPIMTVWNGVKNYLIEK